MQNALKVGPIALTFHRTCRVPERSALGKPNALPASLGTFPLFKASELGDRRPEEFHPESYLIPVWTREALWIGFHADTTVAVSVGTGKINAVTGKPLGEHLCNNAVQPQNYLVCPPQPWLDGFKTADGTIRQFVAVKLGSGETVEGQLTGKEEVGGIQFAIHLPRVDLVKIYRPKEHVISGGIDSLGGELRCLSFGGPSLERMGLGAGGEILQKIYDDPYVEYSGKRPDQVWYEDTTFKALVHLVHASGWEALTGQKAPSTPVTYQSYQAAGYPWFAIYDEDFADVKPSKELAEVKPVGGAPSAHFAEKPGETPDEATKSVW
jgi:hypothetical protein